MKSVYSVKKFTATTKHWNCIWINIPRNIPMNALNVLLLSLIIVTWADIGIWFTWKKCTSVTFVSSRFGSPVHWDHTVIKCILCRRNFSKLFGKHKLARFSWIEQLIMPQYIYHLVIIIIFIKFNNKSFFKEISFKKKYGMKIII